MVGARETRYLTTKRSSGHEAGRPRRARARPQRAWQGVLQVKGRPGRRPRLQVTYFKGLNQEEHDCIRAHVWLNAREREDRTPRWQEGKAMGAGCQRRSGRSVNAVAPVGCASPIVTREPRYRVWVTRQRQVCTMRKGALVQRGYRCHLPETVGLRIAIIPGRDREGGRGTCQVNASSELSL